MKVKRGRPGIKPHIESLIVSRVLKDREKPRKEWTPRKALAFELQEEIAKMGELVPEGSTLEKRISDYSPKTEKPEPQDNPWYVVTPVDFDIPPETLPAVLKMAVHFQQSLGRRMTIREAKWAVRLSSLELKIQVEKWTRRLSLNLDDLFEFVQNYAEMEKVVEKIGSDGIEPWVDDKLYRHLTGKSPKEPVFDKYTGIEIDSKLGRAIRADREERQRKQGESKDKKQGQKKKPKAKERDKLQNEK